MAPEPQESPARRRNRLILLMGALVFPLFALTDHMLAPQAFGATLTVRLCFAGLMALALALLRFIPDRAQMALLFAVCQLAAAASGVVMILNRDLTAQFVLATIPLVIAMFVPLARWPAHLMHGGIALSMNVVPFAVLIHDYPLRAMGTAGFLTGLAAVGLALVIHTSAERNQEAQDEALEALDRQNHELTAMLSKERGRVAAVAGALGEVSRVLTAIDGSAAKLESEAQALTRVAERTDEEARQAVADSVWMGEGATQMETSLLTGREQVDAHVRFDRVTAGPAREVIVRDAAEVAEAVLEIGQSAQQVGEIAQETRLLALNAGVVAMREGNAGGLYVVSTGLRELSEAAESGAGKMRDCVLEVVRAAQRLDQTVAGHATLASLSAAESDQVLEGVQEVAKSIARIRTAVEALGQASRQQSSVAASLAELARQLARSAAGLRSAAADLRAQTDQLWLDAARAA